MKTTFKRILSLIMVLTILGAMLPAVYADDAAATTDSEPVVLTDEDYAITNDVFAQISTMEDAPSKKDATQTQLTDAAVQIVMASENYVEGSLERGGDSFTWRTDEGIRCIYSPRMREKYENMEAPAESLPSGIYNEPVATKGGWPSGNQVYLIAPYYGIDDSFTDQYQNEAASIASAIGDTDGYTLYSGTSVTVDKVANAISNGAVVIFDSHGTTDYESGYDYVSGANYSYLCLTNKTGLTTADYDAGATYFTDSDGYICACVNGAVIANHMTKQSPAGILWMAICLGMATDTMCQPMREMGVEVVYGYSQSVTFDGDYLFEETFWDNMIAGKNVADSIAAMKSKWGNWDWSDQIANYYYSIYHESGYSTIYQARSDYAAFPVVVSDEDVHPGQRSGRTFYGADSLQTVQSTYTLYSQYNVTAQSNNAEYGNVSVNGNVITASPAEGYFAESATVISGDATVSQNGNSFTVSANSDCTVQINFAAKTPVTVSFTGAEAASQTGYAGDSMSLPSAYAPEGFTFLGWTASALSEDTTEKPSYYTNSFIPTADTTLHALYSYVDENESSGTGDYIKVTSTPADWSGEYVIVYEDGGYILDGSNISNYAGNYQTVTISNNTIRADAAEPYKFIIEAYSNGYSIQGASGAYIYGTSGSNSLGSGSSPSVNTISLDSSGNANICCSNTYLRFNSSANMFRYYKSSSYKSQKPIALYVKDGSVGTTYYTSTPAGCDHSDLSAFDAVQTAPDCTNGGYTTYTCYTCGYGYTADQTPATGHSYVNGECTLCGDRSIVITGQPANKTVKAGTTADFTVSAAGSDLTYQWQYRTSSSGSWINVSAASGKTANYSLTAATRHNGYQYRCEITDSAGNVICTEVVNLYVLGIKTQPTNKTVKAGVTAKFTVAATGNGLTYQWQYRTSSSGSWTNVSAASGKTANYSLTTATRHNGYQYRCKVTDGAGNVVYTNVVNLYVLGIKTQPVSKTVVAGKTAKFTVTATGSGLTYQWQYRTSSSGSWKNVSAASGKTANYSLTAAVKHHGYQYRCKVTDSAGNVVYTNAVNLYVLGIKTQPVSKTVKVGATAKFTVTAVGNGLTYQWQYRTSSSGSWKNASATGNKTKTLSVAGAAFRNGYQYRCKITDSAGNVIYTKTIKLTVKK